MSAGLGLADIKGVVSANGYFKKKLRVPIVDASSRAACGDLAYNTTAIAGRVIGQAA